MIGSADLLNPSLRNLDFWGNGLPQATVLVDFSRPQRQTK
jgi:hypothetical protein